MSATAIVFLAVIAASVGFIVGFIVANSNPGDDE